MKFHLINSLFALLFAGQIAFAVDDPPTFGFARIPPPRSAVASEKISTQKRGEQQSRDRSRKKYDRQVTQQPAAKSEVATLKELEQRLASVQAQLDHLILMINGNATKLKQVKAQLEQQIIVGSESIAESKQKLNDLTARMEHQTIEANQSTRQMMTDIGNITARVNDQVYAAAGKDGELRNLEAIVAHQTIVAGQSASETASRLASLDARINQQAVASKEKERQLKNLEMLVSHQILSGSQSANQTSMYVSELNALLKHPNVAVAERIVPAMSDSGIQPVHHIEKSNRQAQYEVHRAVDATDVDHRQPPARLTPHHVQHHDHDHNHNHNQPNNSIEAKLNRIIDLLEQRNAVRKQEAAQDLR